MTKTNSRNKCNTIWARTTGNRGRWKTDRYKTKYCRNLMSCDICRPWHYHKVAHYANALGPVFSWLVQFPSRTLLESLSSSYKTVKRQRETKGRAKIRFISVLITLLILFRYLKILQNMSSIDMQPLKYLRYLLWILSVPEFRNKLFY